MQNKLVALVTGANQCIGLQIAKDVAGYGFTVLVGSPPRAEVRRHASPFGAVVVSGTAIQVRWAMRRMTRSCDDKGLAPCERATRKPK